MSRTQILHGNLERYFTEHVTKGPLLIVDDFPPFFTASDVVTYWHTRYAMHHEATTTPLTDKSYDDILVRLPKSHEYFDYILRVTTPLLTKAGTLYVYGMNDEGIKGAQKKLAELYSNIEVADIKNHGRIVQASDSASPPTKGEMSAGQKEFSIPTLEDFKTTHEVTYADKTHAFTYYPGMFGAGSLDDGTRLLLDTTLPQIKPDACILDYASGSGIIARVIKDTEPTTTIDLLDNDTISLAASHENVTSARSFMLGDSLSVISEGMTYDLVISNPPIHTEKDEQFNTLHDLIRKSPPYLRKHGKLILVAQARIDIEEQLRDAFGNFSRLAETSRFVVWSARK